MDVLNSVSVILWAARRLFLSIFLVWEAGVHLVHRYVYGFCADIFLQLHTDNGFQTCWRIGKSRIALDPATKLQVESRVPLDPMAKHVAGYVIPPDLTTKIHAGSIIP